MCEFSLLHCTSIRFLTRLSIACSKFSHLLALGAIVAALSSDIPGGWRLQTEPHGEVLELCCTCVLYAYLIGWTISPSFNFDQRRNGEVASWWFGYTVLPGHLSVNGKQRCWGFLVQKTRWWKWRVWSLTEIHFQSINTPVYKMNRYEGQKTSLLYAQRSSLA